MAAMLLPCWLAGVRDQLESEAPCRFGWCDAQKTDPSARGHFLQLNVELRIEKSGIAHPSGLGDEELRVLKTETVDDNAGESGDFPGGVFQERLRKRVTAFGGGRDDGKDAGEDLIGCDASTVAEFGPIGKSELLQDLCSNRCIDAGTVVFADHNRDCDPAYIVSAALIADERAVTSGARCAPLGVAPNGGGSSSCDENDGGTLASCFETEFEIGDEADFCIGKCFGQMAPHLFVRFGAADSGEACTESGDLVDVNTCRLHGDLSSCVEFAGCGFEAGTERI